MFSLRPRLLYLLTVVATVAGGTLPARAAALPGSQADTAKQTDTMVMVVDLSAAPGKKLQPFLEREIAKALAAGRTPFVEVGATWCGPCQEIRSHLGNPLMVQAFAGTYIIRLDSDEWKRAERLPLGLATGELPSFFAIDSTGKSVKSLTPDVDPSDIPGLAKKLGAFFQAYLRKKG
jgi:thiol-disulfide isomerase/thioredoxin